MRLTRLASHSVDLDALPSTPLVLDVGCRNWDFTEAVWNNRPKARIVTMDPDPTIDPDSRPPMVMFIQEALVGDDRKTSLYAGWSTGEGNILCDQAPHYAERSYTVPCTNLKALMERLSIDYWDLVKLDCEGAEFQILENWPGPIAGQLSIEFHDWTGPEHEKATQGYYAALFSGPLRHYDVLSHELSTVGPGPAWGHWDSVLRLRR